MKLQKVARQKFSAKYFLIKSFEASLCHFTLLQTLNPFIRDFPHKCAKDIYRKRLLQFNEGTYNAIPRR